MNELFSCIKLALLTVAFTCTPDEFLNLTIFNPFTAVLAKLQEWPVQINCVTKIAPRNCPTKGTV